MRLITVTESVVRAMILRCLQDSPSVSQPDRTALTKLSRNPPRYIACGVTWAPIPGHPEGKYCACPAASADLDVSVESANSEFIDAWDSRTTGHVAGDDGGLAHALVIEVVPA